MTDHPITPPSELLQLWFEQHYDYDKGINELLIEAAQYGADQELQACIEWMTRMGYWGDDGKAIPALYAARRPKPLSLKEQAMRVLLECGYTLDGRMELEPEDIHIIQRALESIDE
jgi:hypothetical protein